jgi:hypothetical protein
MDQTDGSHKGPSPGCKADFQEVPTVVLEFFPGLLVLYGVWHFHDEEVLLLPVGFNRTSQYDEEFTFSARF